MKKNFIILGVVFLFNFQLFSNENDKYINKQISNIDKLIAKGEFLNCIIYLQNDTIETKLLSFNRKRKINHHLFCIEKPHNDSLKILRAEDILGFKIRTEEYISHKSDEGIYFIKKIESGKIILYEKPPIPSDRRDLYYLQFQDYKNLVVINPYENNIKEYTMPNTNPRSSNDINRSVYQTKGLNHNFKIFVEKFLGDCRKVTNMVKSDFYKIQDIPVIVKTYNSCFNE